VHIPKTAGTAIKISLENKNIKDKWIRCRPKEKYLWGHDPFFVLEKYNKFDSSVYKFTVVRNPYDWIYSFYQYLIYTNIRYFPSFSVFLEVLQYGFNDKIVRMRQGQRYYVLNDKGEITLDKIYKFENIQELEKDLELSLPRINVGNYSRNMYLEEYTAENIAIVKKIFSEDFELFGYEKDFK